MTPKEKARKLYNSFESQIYDVDVVDGGGWDNCRLVDKSVIAVTKQCAFIAIDEILNGFRKLLPSSRGYWEQVKTEIENL